MFPMHSVFPIARLPPKRAAADKRAIGKPTAVTMGSRMHALPIQREEFNTTETRYHGLSARPGRTGYSGKQLPYSYPLEGGETGFPVPS